MFAEFISEQLDQRRGLQSKLAKKMGVSRSTITAWRHGAKPEFEMCLRLAVHFKTDPLALFKMVGDPNYETVYRQFLAGQFGAKAAARLAKEPIEPAETLPAAFSEDDLYPNARHAAVHRELQLLLDAGNKEAKAIATMIHLAASQLEGEEATESSTEPTEEPHRKEIYRNLKKERADSVKNRLEREAEAKGRAKPPKDRPSEG